MQKFSNGARGELQLPINNTDLSITLVTGGALFPVANTGTAAITAATTTDWFKLVIQDNNGYEIVCCRTHTAGNVVFADLVRGQEGTTARSFSAGATVGLRPTAGDAEAAEKVQRMVKNGFLVCPHTLTESMHVPANETWVRGGPLKGADGVKLSGDGRLVVI